MAVDLLQTGQQHAVWGVHLTRSPHQLVLKVVEAVATPAIDLCRTAAVMTLARDVGAPVPAVLASGSSQDTGGWQYLLAEHVDGMQWRLVRPLLDDAQVAAAQRDIAEALLAVQSVRLPAFGELDPVGAPVGVDLVTALRRRAQLRITDEARRAFFLDLLDRDTVLFNGARAPDLRPVLCHDDLHHANVLFTSDDGRWRLAGLLDWDKAWAGPAESDVARMAFWDDMTGPGFWQAYRAAVPAAHGSQERAMVHQLLWCLEYPVDTARHRADTTALCHRLDLPPPPPPAA